MKRIIKLLVYIFAFHGVVSSILIVRSMFSASRTVTTRSKNIGNMGSILTAAKMYAVQTKETTGVGRFPVGDSSEIASALINNDQYSIKDLVEESSQLIDAYGTAFHFISNGKEFTIISYGEDQERSFFDDIVMIIDLPKSAL